MPINSDFPNVESALLPEGISIQTRKFDFDYDSLESVPKYWFANNPILTTIENTFSILIPAGERFFIRSVRHYEDKVTDPELKKLVKPFISQEGQHCRAHDQFNNSLKNHGVDLDRESSYSEKFFKKASAILPKKIQLGATAFLEHVTASGAIYLFETPEYQEYWPPQMLEFWKWHAVEELEHKAVAYDLLKVAKVGYFLRIISAIVAITLFAIPAVTIYKRIMRNDPTKVTTKQKQQADAINKKIMMPQLRMIMAYFKPGFHPWQFDDLTYVKKWYSENPVTKSLAEPDIEPTLAPTS